MKLYEQFVESFNIIDSHLRDQYGLNRNKVSSFPVLIDRISKENYIVNKYSSKLKAYAKLRNAIVHDSPPNPIAEPHPDVVAEFQSISNKILLLYSSDAFEVSIKPVYKCTLDDNLLDVMKTMKSKNYTHIPVVDNNENFIGVVSENTFFNCLMEEEIFEIEESSKVDLIKDYIDVAKNDEDFIFKKRDDKVIDVLNLFSRSFEVNKRLGAVFVTHNGTSDNKILGIITTADVASLVD